MLNDIRLAFRQLLKNPSFTAVAVLTLALGIGANTAVFSLINAVLLRSLPFKEADRLVFLSERSRHLDNMSISYPNFKDWEQQNRVFEQIGAFRGTLYNWAGNDEPERLEAMQVSAGFFSALGVTPIRGRVFGAQEDQPGAVRTTVISEGLWRRRFGSREDLLDQPIRLNGENYTVLGIMPATFQFPRTVELWTPAGLAADNWRDRGNHPGLYVVARLKPGLTLVHARTEMEIVTSRLAQQYPDSNTGNSATLMTLRERMVGQFRPALLILFSAVGFVLLIACANLASLLLARAASRRKEMAIRLALGAGRIRVLRQLLSESVLLALIGGVVGLIFAAWGVSALTAMVPQNISQLLDIRIEPAVLFFTFALAVFTGVLFGLAPAWQASRPDLNETLKETGRGETQSGSRHRLHGALVIAELALALVLLIGAGLMIRSFARIQAVSPGFEAAGVLTMNLALPQAKYTNSAQRLAFYQPLLQRLAASPGVQAAALATFTPMQGGGSQSDYSVEGEPPSQPGQGNLADYCVASPDYFRALRIPLLRGRAFTDQDLPNGLRVAIVDETFARKHWPKSDPIGKRFQYGDGRGTNWLTIVGIVGQVKNYGVDVDSRVQTYIPIAQNTPAIPRLLVRSSLPLPSLINAIRTELHALDKEMPMTRVRTMEEFQSDSTAIRRLSLTLLGAFAGVALALAAIGTYGLMAYSVSQRTREIGIRMALGARRPDILGLMLGQGGRLVGLGLLLGLIASYALTRLMVRLLFQIEPTDTVTYLATPTLLSMAAFLAIYLPARRATKVDPMEALRCEG